MRGIRKKTGNRILAWVMSLAMLLTLLPQTAVLADGTTATAPTEDGIYSVTGRMIKVGYSDTNETASMANDAIVHNVKLTVENGTYRLTLNFQGIDITFAGATLHGYLKDLKYYKTGFKLTDKDKNSEDETYNVPSGELADVTVESLQKYTDGTTVTDDFGTDYPDIVSFEMAKEALTNGGKVPLQVFVPIMDDLAKQTGSGSGTQDMILVLDWSTVKAVNSADDAIFSEGDVVEENPNSGSSNNNSNNNGSSNNNNSSNNNSSNNSNGSNSNNNNNSSTGTSTAKIVKGQTYTVGANKYKALSANTVAFAGLKDKEAKKASIPATVTVGGVSCKVVSIAANACKNCKKLKKVTIGANVTAIGAKAFYGCKSLKKITVKTTKLKSVGKKALYGINKKAVIKVPKKQKKKYTKLFKNKGQKKTVKVK